MTRSRFDAFELEPPVECPGQLSLDELDEEADEEPEQPADEQA